jgi:hypothetical protein
VAQLNEKEKNMLEKDYFLFFTSSDNNKLPPSIQQKVVYFLKPV